MDKSTSVYSKVLGIFALVQIVIAALQLTMQIKEYQDRYFSVFVAVIFSVSMYFSVRIIDSILKK